MRGYVAKSFILAFLAPEQYGTDCPLWSAFPSAQGPGRASGHAHLAARLYDASHSGLLDPSTGEGLSHQGFVSAIFSTGPKCLSVP